jgi:hypothetical protein
LREGQLVRLTGAGFRPKSRVKIVFEATKRVVVGSAVIKSDGAFDTSVVVPAATPGQHKLQVVGKSPSGQTTTWVMGVTVLADRPIASLTGPGPDVAAPVLLAVAVAFPMATWFVLEILALRRRRVSRPAGGR